MRSGWLQRPRDAVQLAHHLETVGVLPPQAEEAERLAAEAAEKLALEQAATDPNVWAIRSMINGEGEGRVTAEGHYMRHCSGCNLLGAPWQQTAPRSTVSWCGAQLGLGLQLV